MATPAPAISCFMPCDLAPETGTESDNEGLENGDCLIEKFHK